MSPKKGKAHCSHMSHRRPRIHGPATILGRGTSFFRCSASRACSWQTRKTSKIYRHVELISGSTCYLATPKFQLQVFSNHLDPFSFTKKESMPPQKRPVHLQILCVASPRLVLTPCLISSLCSPGLFFDFLGHNFSAILCKSCRLHNLRNSAAPFIGES